MAHSLDEFYSMATRGETAEIIVPTGESLDYPYLRLTCTQGVTHIISMADSDTELGRITLTGASANEIDRAAGGALGEVQTRPFRQWTRDQLRAKLRQIDAERQRLDATDFTPTLPSTADARWAAASMQAQRTDSELRRTNRHIAYLKQVQAINFEVHLRNDPALVARFGPGAD